MRLCNIFRVFAFRICHYYSLSDQLRISAADISLAFRHSDCLHRAFQLRLHKGYDPGNQQV
jgi:hypothetical protein